MQNLMNFLLSIPFNLVLTSHLFSYKYPVSHEFFTSMSWYSENP